MVLFRKIMLLTVIAVPSTANTLPQGKNITKLAPYAVEAKTICRFTKQITAVTAASAR